MAEDILGRINVPKISPKSSSSGSKPIADVIPETEPDTSSTRPTRLNMAAGATPAGKPIKAGIEMTPAEHHALEYLAKVRQLTPDIKEVKRAFLPSSVKFNGILRSLRIFVMQLRVITANNKLPTCSKRILHVSMRSMALIATSTSLE